MNPNYFVTCPLFPLFPRDQGYSQGFQLPARMRPKDCVNLEKLTQIFRESLLYEEKLENDQNPAVISVLSPYSKFFHVMVLDLSSKLYLPAPEWFSPEYFHKICNLCNKCIIHMRKTQTKCLCAGYNWSPYSYGTEEEKTGAQSVTTKFHFSIWSWDDLMPYDGRKISEATKRALGENNYGLAFSKMIWNEIKNVVVSSNLFGNPEFSSRSLYTPFNNTNISDILQNSKIIYDIAGIISSTLNRISKIISGNLVDDYKKLLKKTKERPLTDEELEYLRSPVKPKKLEEYLSETQNEYEKEFISALYGSIVNRYENSNPEAAKWRKHFGYSLVMCESSLDKLSSGLRIYSLPQCGPGGVVEALGCILTRPENCIADEKDMIAHNRMLWDLSESLN
ncbi:hypothetical protein TVAG_358870 [Trichomonas vaginalis G3]|uniref:Uncharacterized protein n=1 Tax=Trichomonas vaginalis (strain ATCC PRA-98 / G3) TaxID=412133 RepID=A2E890_TRIV3|nr:hypothetical protein TVAGG3_1027260 [Trichomonas vaginalis G3]EAY11108.1 hypothetical protein TVAG_358870 [Trichomonas vaginalis G3]KAI5492593.1 hypothetical protein TVAGG3_1027260 [Trichomonas vaginalis G3]|eukprot:XP_001323331.1 hypothetical protein [Trichomonas vaginalis G3]